jgi:hypothetical protein
VAGSLLLAVPVGLAGMALAAWLSREERRREGAAAGREAA